MKKILKKRAGFTLVELIVVIAILGILAAVAIPAYSSYIKKANDAAAVTELSAVLTAAEAANAKNSNAITKIDVSSAGAVTVTFEGDTTPTGFYAEFAEFYGTATATENTSATVTGLGDKLTASSSFVNGAEWANSTWSGKTAADDDDEG